MADPETVFGDGGAFIGRKREMAQLLAGLEDAVSGNGRLFLIDGEPGIGKTRLASEVASQGRERGARVLWGRCWEEGGAPAYWPWVQAIRPYVRSLDAEGLRTQLGLGSVSLALILPEVRELLPDLPELPSLDAEGARFRLFDDTARFLWNMAEVQPVVIILDDLQSADTPSLLLLQFVARELLASRVLVVGLAREVDREHPLRSASADLLRYQGARRLSLGGLSESEVGRFIEASMGTSPHDALVSLVHEETEGNPLFLGEVVRLLADEGRLEARSGPPFRFSVPEGVREVIGRRLGNLSEECVGVLTLASVLGREFGVKALQSATKLSGRDLLIRLDEAATAHVLTEAPGVLGRWRFAHALVRDTLYDDVGAAQRVRLHRQIGESLEELYGQGVDAHLAELAHHFLIAAPEGDPAPAVDYARRAGERAATLLAFEEAVRLFGMALQALDLEASPEEEERCRLLLALGDAKARMGDLTGAKETFQLAAQSARAARMPDLLAAAALGYGGRFVWARAGDDQRIIPLLEEALVAIGDKDRPLRARLLARLSGALRDREPRDLAASVSREAVDVARRIGDPATLAYALEGRFAATWWPENPEERFSLGTEILKLAKEAGDPERTAQGHDWRICALMELGDIAALDAELAAMGSLVKELRQPAQLWIFTNTRAMRALHDGRLEEAEGLIRDALDLGQGAQRWDAIFSFRLQTFVLRQEQGRLPEMEDTIKRSIGEYPTRWIFRCLLPYLFSELGRPAEARRAFEAIAGKEFADIPRNNDWLFAVSWLAEVAADLGDLRRSAALYDLLLPFADRSAVHAAEVSMGSVARSLGILASAMSRWEEASDHFEKAMAANERMGARPWLAHSRFAYARMLVSRSRQEEQDRAGKLVAAASETSRELGMVALQARISAFLDRNDLRPRPSAAPTPAPPPQPVGSPNIFRREGEYWSISFDGETFRLRDSKGLRYLAALLAGPGREIPAFELIMAGVGKADQGATEARAHEPGLRTGGVGDAGQILDDRAKAAYRRRLGELEEELTEADAWSDPERAARARQEIDFLEQELTAAVGLGGRDRRAASDAERARISVTKAIRSAMDRIRKHSKPLADHLASTIRTGSFCSYMPDPRVSISWNL